MPKAPLCAECRSEGRTWRCGGRWLCEEHATLWETAKARELGEGEYILPRWSPRAPAVTVRPITAAEAKRRPRSFVSEHRGNDVVSMMTARDNLGMNRGKAQKLRTHFILPVPMRSATRYPSNCELKRLKR